MKLKRGLKYTRQRRPKEERLKLKRPTEERAKFKKADLEYQERALKVKKNLVKKLPKKLLWLEDENLMKQTGRSMKDAKTKLPADPCYLLQPK